MEVFPLIAFALSFCLIFSLMFSLFSGDSRELIKSDDSLLSHRKKELFQSYVEEKKKYESEGLDPEGWESQRKKYLDEYKKIIS